jgi:2-isopropylmalate synthase
VAATELGLLAGADRVEGTLFGNGERTGNVDIVTLALNLYTQGVDPGLDLHDINLIQGTHERCTLMSIPPRHPYAGDLVFTAFSGSHQDAIKKGMDQQDSTPGAHWEVPYLPIDPQDIGRTYEAIIRINSQSGKGGVAYIMDTDWGFELPKEMRKEFGQIVNEIADATGEEISSQEILAAFQHEYLDQTSPLGLDTFVSRPAVSSNGTGHSGTRPTVVECEAGLRIGADLLEIRGHGNGPIDAFVDALRLIGLGEFDVTSYAEHSLGKGANATAVSYIQIEMPRGFSCFGAALDTDIEVASIKAVLSAVNRAIGREELSPQPVDADRVAISRS